MKQLHEFGAKMVVTDIDRDSVEAMVEAYGVDHVAPDAIYDVGCDVFCPCALGGIIKTAP